MEYFKKEDLEKGKEFVFSDEINENELEVWYKEDGPNWSQGYQIMFNGERDIYKTYPHFLKNAVRLIKEYNLKIQEDEDI